MVPITGISIVGVGVINAFVSKKYGITNKSSRSPLASYLVDAISTHVASAPASFTVFRSVFGAISPLAGPPMYSTPGL
ncbi:uncharacterized protein BDZ83DRAFT_765105 [Colletotrichum acutatum]|uniref:Uncharacterized protein n=1 Tax=Glomerella acutata TaxID=27357 RepID=A0AAD8X9M2_GLOAC|nr:uncharacterized protein BDZ83DRAFT_765105 [Colletotrichum acutatum]KAK1711933.1 hypothetical protein BDZ83DRAFT_765105 [Colletotrichum acutatum]